MGYDEHSSALKSVSNIHHVITERSGRKNNNVAKTLYYSKRKLSFDPKL